MQNLDNVKNGYIVQEFDEFDMVKIVYTYKSILNANKIIKNLNGRAVNLNEIVSEGFFCWVFRDKGCYRAIKGSSCDCLLLVNGEYREVQVKASSIEYDLTSFGPKSKWDLLYFMDFSRVNEFYVYLIPNELIYSMKMNANQVFTEQQDEKRRPRTSLKKIIEEHDIQPERKFKVTDCLPDNFAQMLKITRESNGLTQEELAQKCNLSREHIVRLETNSSQNPTLDVIQVLSQELNVPQDLLLLNKNTF